MYSLFVGMQILYVFSSLFLNYDICTVKCVYVMKLCFFVHVSQIKILIQLTFTAFG